MANQIVVSAGAKVRNLQDVIIGTSGVLTSLGFDVANGVPRLDVNGKILVSQLPNSVMEYKGTWNISTNTPTLVNGTGNQGDVYLVEGAAVGGTAFNFGAGPITFFNGDQAIYSGSIWQRASGATGTVTSVAITESGDSLNITGSPITTSGTINIGFNGTNLQYVNGAGNLTTFPTLITSIGLSMPSAFSVANSPLTANGTIAVTGAGVASQYIRGDGTLADFPSSGGGGSSVSYYLNGGTSQGTIGGVTYYEMSKTAVVGTGVDFSLAGDGLIVSFLTDANDPAQLNIPAGNWNYEIYASMSSNGGTPELYAELYKYDGTTFTLIATSPHEILYDGTALNLYTFAMAVPATSLTLTDRLAIKLYATNSGGKTTTIHTQDSHLCQVITTFSTGITALNGLTAQVQYFQTGTSGTDFNISSTTATHTFNIPDASATARGLITTGTQTIAGTKTFNDATKNNGGIFLQNASSNSLAGYMNLGGLTNGVKFTSGGGISNSFTLPSATGYTFTFPNATGTLALTSDISYPVTSVFGRTGAVVATSGDYTTAQVTESGNLYFTDSRARLALSFVAGSGAYNSTTGVITIPTNNNQITNGSNYITLGSLSAGTGISYNNTTGVITNSAPDQTVSLTAGAGISVSGTYPSFTIASTITQYTDALARAAISLTTTGTSGAATYNNTTGVLNIPQYIGGVTSVFGRTGAVVATEGDYSLTQLSDVTITSPTTGQVLKYNGTAWVNDTDANTGTVTSVAMTVPTGLSVSGSPITTSGTLGVTFAAGYSIPTDASQTTWDTAYTNRITSATSPLSITSNVISISQATTSTNGYLSSTDWNTFNGKGSGTVTSVGLSSATSGVTIGSSPVTTSGTITLAIATATTSQNGLLSSTDWTTFNNKQNNSANLTSLAGLTFVSTSFVKMTASGTFALDTNTYQGSLTLTTTGTSGAATLVGNTLNIPQYSGGGSMAIGGSITSATAGSVLFAGAAGVLAQDNANFFWDDTNNRLGIGTATPSYKLDVSASSIIRGTLAIDNNGQDAAPTEYIRFERISQGSANYFNSIYSSTGSGTNLMQFRLSGTGGSQSTIMTLNGTGVVGIGTATIGSKLQVNGNAAIGYSASTAAPTNGLQVAGNIGVGVSPSAWSTAYSAIQLNATASLAGTSTSVLRLMNNSFVNTSGEDRYITTAPATAYLQNTGQHIFYTAASGTAGTIPSYTQKMVIDVSGNVTIGPTAFSASKMQVTGSVAIGYSASTAAPTNGLAVAGNIQLGQATAATNVVLSLLGVASKAAGIKFLQSGVEQWTIGNGIASEDNNFELYNGNGTMAMKIIKSTNAINFIGNVGVTGTGVFSSSVTATSFFESSDSRLKTLIQDNYQTKGIASITPKLYTKNGKVELGYFAQDFVGILDSAVSKGSDDMLSLSYREVLVAKVYALEQRIKELENK